MSELEQKDNRSIDDLPKLRPMHCPECGKEQVNNSQDGSDHEEGCQIGVSEQQEYEDKLAAFRKSQEVSTPEGERE